jgi:hypothetical protein
MNGMPGSKISFQACNLEPGAREVRMNRRGSGKNQNSISSGSGFGAGFMP